MDRKTTTIGNGQWEEDGSSPSDGWTMMVEGESEHNNDFGDSIWPIFWVATIWEAVAIRCCDR